MTAGGQAKMADRTPGDDKVIALVPKKGDSIRLDGSNKRGIVIDWGVYHQKYKRYMLARRETADCIRVWTSSAIEVWPLNMIRPDL